MSGCESWELLIYKFLRPPRGIWQRTQSSETSQTPQRSDQREVHITVVIREGFIPSGIKKSIPPVKCFFSYFCPLCNNKLHFTYFQDWLLFAKHCVDSNSLQLYINSLKEVLSLCTFSFWWHLVEQLYEKCMPQNVS